MVRGALEMELKLDDLFIQCSKCGGTGSYTEESGAKPGGIGVHYRSTGTCDACGGRGGKLTEVGSVLNEFFQILKRQHFI